LPFERVHTRVNDFIWRTGDVIRPFGAPGGEEGVEAKTARKVAASGRERGGGEGGGKR